MSNITGKAERGRDARVILTIGHSSHPIDVFLRLLNDAGVTALADVRSAPWSRRWPQYRQAALKAALGEAGIAYVWLGAALGGKPKDPALMRGGRADYNLITASPAYGAALDRLEQGMKTHVIALMCAEKDPAQCHRTHLVTPGLIARGITVRHLLADGGSIDHAALAPDPPVSRDLFE